VNQKNFWEKNDLFPELDPCFEMGVIFQNRIFGKNWKIWESVLNHYFNSTIFYQTIYCYEKNDY
jgi:hypothetical protein